MWRQWSVCESFNKDMCCERFVVRKRPFPVVAEVGHTGFLTPLVGISSLFLCCLVYSEVIGIRL